MQIVLNHKPSDPKTQNRFNKLWQRLQKQQKLNRKFEADIEKLTEVYQQQCLPLEREAVPEYCRLAERLLVLFTRKSLAQWHRHAMLDWIVSLLGKVRSLDSEAADRLLVKYKETMAYCEGVSVAELEQEWEEQRRQEAQWEAEFEQQAEAYFSDEDEAMDEALRDLFGALNEDEAEASFQEDLFGLDEEQPEKTESSFAGLFAESPSDGEVSLDRWLQKLFRRTAKVLHPDREPDAALREQKQQLMGQLLEAREREDVMAMLTLYTEHVEGGNLEMTEQEMDALCRMLDSQLVELEMNQQEWLHEHPLRQIAYETLYDSTEKARKRRLKEYKALLAQQVGDISATVDSLRNLNCLKHTLRAREEAMHAIQLEQLMDGFEVRF